MNFCGECGTLLPAGGARGACPECGASYERPEREGTHDEADDDAGVASVPTTDLEQLPTTKSGSIKKADAMQWLLSRDSPSKAELRRSMVEKPSGFSGSTFPTDISTIRITGGPEFLETIAGLFSWVVDMEDYSRRVEINLKEVEDKESGDRTGNYALYLSVAERG